MPTTSNALRDTTGLTSESSSFQWLALFGSLGIVIAAFLLQPAGHHHLRLPGMAQPFPEMCMVKRVLGWSCPGCGLTRGVVSAAHGRWLDAFHFNPAGPQFFILFLFQVPYRLNAVWRLRHRLSPRRIPGGMVYILVTFAVMVAQWVGRWLV